MPPRLIAFLQLFLECCAGAVSAIHLQDTSVLREIIKHGPGLLQEQRQIIFNSGWHDTLADIAVYIAGLWITLEHGTKAPPEEPDRILVHGKLARR
jgi:hypothetical protein